MLICGDLLGKRMDFAPTGSLLHFRHLGNIKYTLLLKKYPAAKLSVAWLPFIQHPVHLKYFTHETSVN